MEYYEHMKHPLVFISYNSADRHEAIKLTEMLRQREVEVWIDEEQIAFGDSIPQRIAEGLRECDVILALVSSSWAESRWCQAEYESLLVREIENGQTTVIPVRLDNTDLPPLLLQKKYFDIRVQGYPKFVYDLTSLVSQIELRSKRKVIDSIATNRSFHCSMLAMIIGGVITDFPVSTISDERILEGRSLFDLYRTTSHMIDVFVSLAESLRRFVARTEAPQATNRKLLDVAREMRDVSAAIQGILDGNSSLRTRLSSVLQICVAISEVEGAYFASFGFLSQNSQKQLEAGYETSEFRRHFGLDFHETGFRNSDQAWVAEYDHLLNSLSAYKYQLREAVARVSATGAA